MAKRSDVRALRNLIDQSYRIISSDPVIPGGIERCRELLGTARLLARDLVNNPASVPAAALGKLGGQRTAERGPDYFRKIAAMRKTRSGGRPRKEQ